MQEDSFYAKHLDRKFSQQSKKVEVIGPPTDLSRVDGKIRLKAEDHGLRTSRHLSMNDLLSNFDDVITSLRRAGLRPANTFGSTSEANGPPKNFVISVGTRVPVAEAKAVIKAVKDQDLKGIGIADDESDRDKIFVGAYTYDDGENFLRTNSDDFNKLLRPGLRGQDFFDLIRNYDGGVIGYG